MDPVESAMQATEKESERAQMADVRRCLAAMRRAWLRQTQDSPLTLCEVVSNNTTISQFAFQFVLGHHVRR